MKTRSSLWSTLGPGILFAGAAVGTSHIVQSTRAGADYSMGFALVFILIALAKYPATRFGKDYANATGRTLIHNYVSYGRLVTCLYSILILLIAAFVCAALGLVSASIINAILPNNLNGRYLTVAILIISGALLWVGKYGLLESLNKVLVSCFTLLILVTTAIVAVQANWGAMDWGFPDLNKTNITYMVAIAGWLLTPMEASVFLSLWTAEKSENSEFDVKDSNFDFNLSYWMSLVLALCFLLMGASLLHEQGQSLPAQGGAFIAAVITLFSDTLGSWSFPVIALIAFSIMYSSLLTVMDGYARNIEKLIELKTTVRTPQPFRVGLLSVLISSSLVILFFMKSFTFFIDVVGILVFVLGPIFAIFNHRAIFGSDVALKDQPSRLLRIGSWIGIIVMTTVALSYLYLRFFTSI